MKITEERMNEVLPPNILESELDLATKKVLAALCDWYLNSPAKESGIVIISNKELATIACVGGTQLQKALRQLQDYNLVDRVIGTGLGNASQYKINFKQMMKPLKRKTFAELFNLEFEESESSEKPISTIVQYSIAQSSSDKPSSSYNSSDKSIEGKSIEEENIPGGARLDEDLFGTKTYIKNRNTKNVILKEDSNKELERECEEGMTEPNSKNENEGKEDPSEYQINEIPTGENQDFIPNGVQEEGAGKSSPCQSQSNDEETAQQQEEDDSSAEHHQPTIREEFNQWKIVVAPELENLKHAASREDFHRMEKKFYQFYDGKVEETGFYNERAKKLMDSHIGDFISTWEYNTITRRW